MQIRMMNTVNQDVYVLGQPWIYNKCNVGLDLPVYYNLFKFISVNYKDC